jgi:hypothetical protein
MESFERQSGQGAEEAQIAGEEAPQVAGCGTAPDRAGCRGGRSGPRELSAGGRTTPAVKAPDPWQVATGAAGRPWARRVGKLSSASRGSRGRRAGRAMGVAAVLGGLGAAGGE